MAVEVNPVKPKKVNVPDLSTFIENYKVSFAIFKQNILFYPAVGNEMRWGGGTWTSPDVFQ